MSLRFQPTLVAQDEGRRDGMDPNPHLKAELEACKWVGEKLERYYPGHAWDVRCNISRNNGVLGGVVSIRINALMSAKRFYNINMRDLLTENGTQIIMRAAGELLERYQIPRAGFDMDNWRSALNRLPILAQRTGRGDDAPTRD